MAKIVDYGAFAERLKSATSRWDLLREFQREWGYAIGPDSLLKLERWSEDGYKEYLLALDGKVDGYRGVDLALPIPAALDEWWELPYNSFIHDERLYAMFVEYPPTVHSIHADLDGVAVVPIPDDSDLVAPDADHRVCVFMIDMDGCNEWGYAAADAHESDPRVLVRVRSDERQWAFQSRSISEFFLQLAVDRLPTVFGWCTSIRPEDVGDDRMAELVARIEAELPSLGFEPWRELGREGTVRGGPDVLVKIVKNINGQRIHFTGRTPEAVIDLFARLGMRCTENELRAPWELGMGEVVDYGAFAERLNSATSRWDLLREFQEEWGYAVEPGSSPEMERWSEDEHNEYLLALDGKTDGYRGVDLTLPVPAALDEWWELPFNSLTRESRLYCANPVYPPTVRPEQAGYDAVGPIPDDSDLVPLDADHRVCVFMIDEDRCTSWGYPAADAHEPDPRVLASVSEDEGRWALQARSISEFFLQLAVHRLSSEVGWGIGIHQKDFTGDGDMAELVARIEAELPALGFEPWHESGRAGTVRGGPDVLARLPKNPRQGILLSGRTAEALSDLSTRLGLESTEDGLRLSEDYQASESMSGSGDVDGLADIG
ncbi:hypothetical protein AB0L06_09930 [Spirillospora sp. NPDC052269]